MARPNEMLATRNKPRRNVVREDLSGQDCLRVYRNSPEDVMLQMRRTKDYIGIALSFDEARALAAMLIAAAGEQ